jgi:CRISPR-associated protein Csm3
MKIKLLKYKKIDGTIKVKTGLHIGGSADRIEIGGNDNPILKHPLTSEPYIPGSSLKGKMRSLLEFKLGKVEPNGEPHKWHGDPNCPIMRIFGTSDDSAGIGPTRLIVRDAELTQEFKDKMANEGVILTEDKYENTINRITARANPRPLERVPAGVEFKFEMSYRIFDMNGDNGLADERLFDEYIPLALNLIELDTLGGSGTRGSGKVKFEYNVTDVPVA